ncbi:MAG TPA: endopeptidase La, partial [Thermodesulfobacteriaceae bacterium]|nr:endopeptidase La [Thermodesulfobacteriaceae bacterium]
MAEKELPARPEEIRDLPVIPSDAVLFPHMIVPFVLTEPGLLKAVEEALSRDRMVAVVAVKDPKAERKELFQFGTLALILRASRVELDRVRIVVQGLSRIQVLSWVEDEPFPMARVQLLAETFSPDREAEALAVNIRQMFGRVLELSPHLPGELRSLVENLEDLGMLADLSVAHLNVPHHEKQALLETLDVKA